jgi:molybdate transport system substrate-binding protein
MPLHRLSPLLRALALLCLLLPQTARAEPLTVFAAASLKTALDAVAAAYAEQTGEAPPAISYAGSSALARQIERGAPADLFLSANSDWMDHLQAADLLAPGTRRDLLGNRLVLVAPGADGPPLALPELPARLGEGRLAMALVEAVPAGIYGREALMSLGLWQDVAPRVVQTDNVRAALALVALGEAALGLVYATDAVAEPRVHVVAEIPAEAHAPVVYPAAVTRHGDTGRARAFLDYLAGPEAAAIFRRQGFTLLAE